jgi:transcriptional regulator with XRE-family HTH domain
MDKSIHSKDYAVFLRLLRDARKKAGLTQAQLAHRLGET